MTDGPLEPRARSGAGGAWPTSGGWPTPGSAPAADAGTANRSATSGTSTAAPPRRPMTVGTAAAARRPGRRARLTIRRIDPWSTLKFSFFYGVAGMVVLVVAVVVLYGLVDAMGVISSLRSFFDTVQSQDSQSITKWFSFGRVLLIAIVVGIVNVVLFTAFATVTAFIYNVTTDIVGGVEITLAERG